MKDEIRNTPVQIVAVLSLYLLLTLIMTYPIAFSPGEHYSIHNDYLQGLWNFWWFRESLVELGRNPYFTDYLFYPTGISLAFHTLSITNAAMALPLLSVVDLATAYNIVYLVTFVLSGLGSYLLVHDLTGNRQAAFLSGIVLAFCPYHFVKSYQIWAASLEWMPFFAFFFLRFLRVGGLRYATWSALMLFLASLSSWYLMAFTFLFILFALVYCLVVRRDFLFSNLFLKDLSFFGGLFGLLILPFAYPMLREVIFGESHMYTSLYAQFLKGSHMVVNGRTGSTFQEGMTQLTGIRLARPLFWPGILGYATLFLAVWGVIKGTLREKGLWVAATILFFVFLLGPHLTVFDRTYDNFLLPWLILDKLPIFKALRYPHRFMAPFMMCVAVMAGSGASSLAGSVSGWKVFRKSRLVSIPTVILSVLVLAEYFEAPVGSYEIRMSPFYSGLDAEEGDYAILEVPVMTPFATRYMFFQSVHGKKIVGGQVVHPREEIIEFLKVTPVIRELTNPVLAEERGEKLELPDDSAAILGDLGIRYVIVHTDFLSPYESKPPVRKAGRRWNRDSLLPPLISPQRDLLQETFYYGMRKRTAFDDPLSLGLLLDELEEKLGSSVYEDDQVTVFRVGSGD